MTSSIVCLGYGYVASALARRLGAWRILGTNRAGTESAGAEIAPFDGEPSERLVFALSRADAILCSIPPDEAGCPAFRALEDALARSRAWKGYLSTTGVYGDRGGGWAFEDDPPTPASAQAKRRVLAERQWHGLPHPGHVFRLPGIYGPGRSALERVRDGTARRVVKPGLVHARVFVEDIASALEASLARPNPGRVYNICDDAPSPPQDVIAEAAALLGVSPPPETDFETAQLSPEARRFYLECRRVSNARAKAELGWRPQCPSYREGLRACLGQASG